MKKLLIITQISIFVLLMNLAVPALVKAALMTPVESCGETCARLFPTGGFELSECDSACVKPTKAECDVYCALRLEGVYADNCRIACLALDGILYARLNPAPDSGAAPLTVDFFANIYNYTDISDPFDYKIDCTNNGSWELTKEKDGPGEFYERALCTYTASATAKLEVTERATGKKATATAAITIAGDTPPPPGPTGGDCQTTAECKSGEICDFQTSKCILVGPSSPIKSVSGIDALIRSVARWIAIIISIIAVIFIILGGAGYITAGGNEEKAKTAQNKIVYGLIGLGVAALAWGAEALVRSVLRMR